MSEREVTSTGLGAESSFISRKTLSPNKVGLGDNKARPGAIGSSKAFRYILLSFGFALLIWTIFAPRYSVSESAASPLLPISIGAGSLLTGLAAGTVWQRFALLLSLTIAGQAASLLMIDAGRLIHFQHYRSFSELLTENRLSLAVIVIQTLVVATASLKYLKPVGLWIRKNLGGWKLVFVVPFWVLAAAAVTPDFAVYANSVLIGTWVQVLSLISLILLVAAVPIEGVSRFKRFWDKWITEAARTEKIKLDGLSVAAALWVLVLSSSLSLFVYETHPHVPDETQYVFQARYMAAGQLTVKPPLVREAFAMYMVPHMEERWFGIFSPGWPALLAVGELAGVVWLINPLLAGLCVLLAYLFLQEIYSRSFARVAVILLSCSPWFVFMAMSLMSHVATLAFALAAAVLCARALRSRSRVLMCLAGTMVGFVSLIRPLDGAVVGLLLGVWIVVRRDGFARRLASTAVFTGGMIGIALLILPYNLIVTGQAGLMPIDTYYDKYFWPKAMALGFGPERGMGWGLDAFPGHSPLEAVVNSALNIFQLNTELFGWGIGSMLLVSLLLFSRGVSIKDIWAWGAIAVVAGVYSLFWYHGGPDFGARYWFLTIIPLIALTVSGIQWLSGKISESADRTASLDSRVAIAAVMLCMVSTLVYIPWRASDKYFGYLGMHPGIRELARQHDFGRSLVLIRGGEHPDYQSAWIYNPLNFEGDAPIYAHDKSPQIRAELLRAYGDRPIWIVDGPTIANGRYKITQGPVTPSQIPSETTE